MRSAAATKLRKRLGESLASVQKYDALPRRYHDILTGSAASLCPREQGNRYRQRFIWLRLRFFQRAITLDPNFAMAYLQLAESYQPQGELALAAENTRKAYDLRERTSDHEKLSIAVFYEIVVTGNLEAARRSCALLAHTYPHDESVQIYLGTSLSYAEITSGPTQPRSEHLRSIPTVQTTMSV